MGTTNLDDISMAIRHAELSDQATIIKLSQQVQDRLTASGSLQHIGPLEDEVVTNAIVDKHCFVLEKETIIGCALVRHLDSGYFASADEFNMENYERPWLYLHSIMLEPGHQGQGYGVRFVEEVLEKIADEKQHGGTIFLDCWAGNGKLRQFYAGLGFNFAAVVPEEDYEIAVFHRPLRTASLP